MKNRAFIPAKKIYISGAGYKLGKECLDNATLIHRYKLNIRKEELEIKTGILSRYFLGEDDYLSDIAAQAARNALIAAQITIEQVDRIIVASSTADYLSPSMAAVVQEKIGASNIPCFDIGAACAGFIYALDMAMRCIETGDDNILLIGADARSRTLDFSHPEIAGLYGDGAGAFVISSKSNNHDFQLMCSKLFADVREYKAVIVPSVGSPEAGRKSKLQMQNGKGVMKSVLKSTPLMIDALLDETSHAIDDIDMYITHQPNLNLLMAIANKMKIGHKNIYSSFPLCGNTVAASIPITFCKALESKAIKPKDTLMLLAMGAGFVGGGVIVN